VVGVDLEKGETYYPYSTLAPQTYEAGGVGLSEELSAGGISEVSGPLLVWNQPQVSNLTMAQPVMVSNLNSTRTTYTGNSQSFSNSASVSGGSSGGTGSSLSQVLSSLEGALEQLSAVLSNLK